MLRPPAPNSLKLIALAFRKLCPRPRNGGGGGGGGRSGGELGERVRSASRTEDGEGMACSRTPLYAAPALGANNSSSSSSSMPSLMSPLLGARNSSSSSSMPPPISHFRVADSSAAGFSFLTRRRSGFSPASPLPPLPPVSATTTRGSSGRY
uniref:Uncharacterized protein n=1 Tax=Arundo donax TaxID=35708 RepID=A0A0A9DV92_ARUDO